MIRAVFASKDMFKSLPFNAMKVDISFRTKNERAVVPALIDSGATENFIHYKFARKYRLPLEKLAKPRPVRNVDGTTNNSGYITHAIRLNLQYCGQEIPYLFYMTDLGKDDVILGFPFLYATNPPIDWTEGKLFGSVIASTDDADRYLKEQIPIRGSPTSEELKYYRPPGIKEPHHPYYSRTKDPNSQVTRPSKPRRTRSDKGTLRGPNKHTKQLSQFKYWRKPEEHSEYPIDMIIRRTTLSTQLAIGANTQPERDWKDIVPKEYHQFKRVFNEEECNRFPPSRPWDHAIELEPNAPTTFDCKVYPQPPVLQEALNDFLKKNLEKGYIRRSKSNYASGFFFIDKKDGKLRPIMDYRVLNKYTRKNKYPIPLQKEQFTKMSGKEWFTKLDIHWGYNNVQIKEEDRHKTAFKTSKGLFECNVMFFGLCNSPATFQAMVDEEFKELINTGDLFIYMDDFLIATKGSLSMHTKRVTQVLQKIADLDLFLKPTKCDFHQKSISFLGHIVGENKLQMDPVKVEAIKNWKPPPNLKELRKFLGFCNYYKEFIAMYSQVARPLHNLTKKTQNWQWNTTHQIAFDILKDAFTSFPILRNPDPNKRYIIDTDASAFAVGAIVQQAHQDAKGTWKLHPIAFYTRSLTPAEKNYDIYDRETLAIISVLKAYRYLLWGAKQPILIRCDHKNLDYFKEAQKLTGRQARWRAFLEDYKYEFMYVPGRMNTLADILSRREDLKEGENISEQITLFPPHLFINTIYLENDPVKRRHALQQIHDTPIGGHPGIANTWDLTKRLYHGPRLRQYVEQYVKGCTKCQETKPQRYKRAPLQPFDTFATEGPFQYVSMDLITDLPKSGKYDTILTIVDQGCSKAAKFIPCNKTIDGEGIATLYLRHLLPLFGIPRRIISDRDPRFAGHFSKAICQATGIKQNLSTAFHPRTDGQSERMNQWIETYLRSFANNRQNNWSTLLPIAEFAHNSWKHEKTKQTPHQLLIGINPQISITSSNDATPSAKQRLEELVSSRSKAQELLQRHPQTSKPLRSISEGQEVWLDARNLKIKTPSRKLAPKRYGPFKVIKKLSPVAYRLALPPSMKIHNVFHIDLLTPHHETDAYGETYMKPPPETIDGQEEYEVEDIVTHRNTGRSQKLQYLIKWKGYPPSENSWVDSKDLHAPEILQRYQISQKKI